MGFFDWYEPQESRACPECGEALEEWQGKGGPNGLLVWRQGSRQPVDQRVDDEVALAPDDRARLSLPDYFVIYSDCPNGHRAWVSCRSVDEAWSEAGPATKHPPPSKFDTRSQRRARRRDSEA